MTRPLPEVLMISKPMIPPWDDSAKNIVRSQLLHSDRYAYRVLTVREEALTRKLSEFEGLRPRLKFEPTYGGAGRYSPPMAENARVFLKGLRPGNTAIYHYFFAPNPLTSMAGRLQKTLARVKTVQTVCSKPQSFEEAKKLLFADIIIVLSEDTRKRLEFAGMNPERMRLVRPAIEPLAPLDTDEKRKEKMAVGLDPDKRVVIFPGDYEFSDAAQIVAQAAPLLTKRFDDVVVVFACRIKREKSIEIRDVLKGRLAEEGAQERVKFLDRVSNMPRLVGASDVVIMPQDNLYGKMDVPLVLLEAMAQEIPLVLADVPPLDEILAFDCGTGVEPGDARDLAEATASLLSHPELAAKMGQKGRLAAQNKFSSLAMSRKIESIYDEVLEL